MYRFVSIVLLVTLAVGLAPAPVAMAFAPEVPACPCGPHQGAPCQGCCASDVPATTHDCGSTFGASLCDCPTTMAPLDPPAVPVTAAADRDARAFASERAVQVVPLLSVAPPVNVLARGAHAGDPPRTVDPPEPADHGVWII